MRLVNLDLLAMVLSRIGAVEAFVRHARTRRLVTVLCLHRVSPHVNSLFPALSPELFRDLCRYLKQRYHIICFRDLDFAANYRPEKPLLILSFDDGYSDFLEYALPVLVDEGLRANQNVITSCAETGRAYALQACIDLLSAATDPELRKILGEIGAAALWKGQKRGRLALDVTRWFQELTADEIRAVGEGLGHVRVQAPRAESRMMMWDDIRAVDRLGFEIGSHTVSHASLDKLSSEQLARELCLSKQRIEEELDHEINVISFPNGRFDPEIVRKSLELGYEYLLTTDAGLNDAGGDLWRRILVYGTTMGRLRIQATGLESEFRSLVGNRRHAVVSPWSGQSRVTVEPNRKCLGPGAAQEGVVSVVVPLFNASAFVGETIRSVMKQTYRQWELVIVDDGSADDSTGAIAPYRSDPRVHYIRQENAGVSMARNRGLAASHGEFVAFLDADDVWKPENLEIKVGYLQENPEVAVVHGDTEDIDALGSPLNHRDTSRGGFVLERLLLWDGTVKTGPSTYLFRRAALDSVGGFDPRLSTAADQDLCIRLAARFRFGYIPKALTLYRVHGGNMHRNIARMEVDHLAVYRKAEANGLFRGRWFRRRCYSNLYMILGGSWWKIGGKRRRGFYWFLRAVLAFPPSAVVLPRRLKQAREQRRSVAVSNQGGMVSVE